MEYDEHESNSSGSEEAHDLRHLAANASAGLRMEMEMLREGRAREMEAGVDKTACIVDRNQFFNTQVGVGYQHKSVVRQRTAKDSDGGLKIIDMSATAGSKAPSALASEGRKRRRHESQEPGGTGSDVDRGEVGRDRHGEGTGKQGSKKDRKNRKEKKEKKDRKEKKEKKEKKERRKKRKKKEEKDDDDDDDEDDEERTAKAKGSKKHKRNKKGKRAKKTSRRRSRQDESNRSEEEEDADSEDDEDEAGSGRPLAGKRKGRKDSEEEIQQPGSPRSSSGSSSVDRSDSGESGDDNDKAGSAASSWRPKALVVLEPLGVDKDTLARARGPLQRLRDLIDERLRLLRTKTTRAGSGPVRPG